MMKIRLVNSWKSWIWDQYLPESMKWNFGNMGLVSSNKSPDGQCWIFWKGRAGALRSKNNLRMGPKRIPSTTYLKKKRKNGGWDLGKILKIQNMFR